MGSAGENSIENLLGKDENNQEDREPNKVFEDLKEAKAPPILKSQLTGFDNKSRGKVKNKLNSSKLRKQKEKKVRVRGAKKALINEDNAAVNVSSKNLKKKIKETKNGVDDDLQIDHIIQFLKKDKEKLNALLQVLNDANKSETSNPEESANFHQIDITPSRRRNKHASPVSTDRVSRSAAAAMRNEKSESKVKVSENKKNVTEEEAIEEGIEPLPETSLDNKIDFKNLTKPEVIKEIKTKNHSKKIAVDQIGVMLKKDDSMIKNLNEEAVFNEKVDSINTNELNNNKVGMDIVTHSLTGSGINPSVEDEKLMRTSNSVCESDKFIKEGKINASGKNKNKIKPGIFSNFNTSDLKCLFKSNTVNGCHSFDENMTDSNDFPEEGGPCEQLSEKIKFLNIKTNDGRSKFNEIKRDCSVVLKQLSPHYSEFKETFNQELLNGEFSQNSKENDKQEINNLITDNNIEECRDKGLTNSFSGNPTKLITSLNEIETVKYNLEKPCVDLVSDERFEITNNNEEDNIESTSLLDSVNKELNLPSTITEVDQIKDSGNKLISKDKSKKDSLENKWKLESESEDVSSDSGNFKRYGSFSNDNQEPTFSPEEDEEGSCLSDSVDKWNAMTESLNESTNLPTLEDYIPIGELNQPVSPLESLGKSSWDFESEAGECGDGDGDKENISSEMTNIDKLAADFVPERFVEEDLTAESSAGDDDDDDDEDNDNGEEEVDDTVGFYITCKGDVDEGYKLTDAIETNVKIPKYYVKKEPSPSELIEEMEEPPDKDANKRKLEEKIRKWGTADLSAIFTLDITQEVLINFCPHLFLQGTCTDVGDCSFAHNITQKILKKHPFEESWMLLEFILKQMASTSNILYELIQTILIFLTESIIFPKEELIKSIERTYLIICFIPFVKNENDRNVLWKLALNTILKTDIPRWMIVKLMFKYVITFFSCPLSKLNFMWCEMLNSLEVDKLPKRVWDVVECLIEPYDFTLPPKVLTAALSDVANYKADYDSQSPEDERNGYSTFVAYKLLTRQLLMTKDLSLLGPHELHVFFERANNISELMEPVTRLRKMVSFDKIKVPDEVLFSGNFGDNVPKTTLKRSHSVCDLREYKKKHIIENEINKPKPVYESEKMLSALHRALDAADTDNVLRVLKESINKSFYGDLIEKLFKYLNTTRSLTITKNLLSKTSKDDSLEAFTVKQSLGRVVLTLMLEDVQVPNWQNANVLLMLLHTYKLNPVILETLCGECSQVRKAVTCSEIHYHNGQYGSAIKVLVSFQLFKRESWNIKGNEVDVLIVERMANFLLKNLIEKKEYDHAVVLFKAIFEQIGEDQGEIDLIDYYEELLHGLFEDTEKFAHVCIDLYWFVNEENPEIELCAVTFRSLLILSYRLQRVDIVHNITEKCVANNIYPRIQERERIVRLHKCFLKEEMEIYITRWFKWFIKVHGTRSWSVKITFTNDSSEDLAMSSRFGMPKFLKQVDCTTKGAMVRVQSVICNLTNGYSGSSIGIRVKDDEIILSSETTEMIIKSLLKL